MREYFRRVDSGDSSLLELYTDDVELYFPKFGVGRGRGDMEEFARRFGSVVVELEHDIEGMDFIVSGDRVVVEGRERGTTTGGVRWPDGVISTGRFCNVFTFRGGLISSVRIYTDPDFASEDAPRVRQFRPDASVR